MKKKSPIQKEIARLQSQVALADSQYYSFSLRGTKDGNIEYSFISSWQGFTSSKPRREIREPCKVNVENVIALLRDIDQPPLIVNTKRDLAMFFLVGGHALIVEELFEAHFSRFLEPKEVGFNLAKGYHELGNDSVTNKAPSKKLRMRIFNRDKRRCRICGRSPKDYIDLELHLHHIVPWHLGGLTEEDNLITLCKSCHDGLDPHYDPTLLDHVKSEGDMNEFVEGTRLYRHIIYEYLKRNAWNFA